MRTSDRTILVVDDDAPSRAVVGIVCGSRGHAVLEAASGAEAVALAGAHRPDLVLLDVELPDVSGMEVCLRLRAAGVDAPIVMLSGHVERSHRTLARWLGADGYLAKPYRVRELMARVDEHLGEGDAQQAA